MKQRNWIAALAAIAVCSMVAGAQMQRVAMTDGVPAQRSMIVADGQPSGTGIDPQVQDDLLAGLDKLGANAKEKNEVNLDKNMMSLAGGTRGGRYAGLSQKMDFIVVRNYEFSDKGQYQKADLDTLMHRLDGTGWSHLVRNESGAESNEIVVKNNSDGSLSDMVILNAEPRELNIVHMHGHFRMEDVNGAMGSAMHAGSAAVGMTNAITHNSGSRTESHTDIAPPAPPAPPASPKR